MEFAEDLAAVREAFALALFSRDYQILLSRISISTNKCLSSIFLISSRSFYTISIDFL